MGQGRGLRCRMPMVAAAWMVTRSGSEFVRWVRPLPRGQFPQLGSIPGPRPPFCPASGRRAVLHSSERQCWIRAGWVCLHGAGSLMPMGAGIDPGSPWSWGHLCFGG